MQFTKRLLAIVCAGALLTKAALVTAQGHTLRLIKYTFVQFYPTVIDVAKRKGTFHEGSL